MGGKHKQAQRTKNNARPSNSGRSAKLLESSVNNFIGFSTQGFEKNPNTLINSLTLETDDIQLNQDFQLAFKKLTKKDSTTKLKALQELSSLVNSASIDDVQNALTHWSRLYSSTVVDEDNRVREAAHLTQKVIVERVGRSIAPHLRSMSSAWFLGQFDPYPPAASAALSSLEIAFPAGKLPAAISFCQKELLDYVRNNILTTLNNKTPTKDRVLSASLLGLGLLMKYSQNIKKDDLSTILSDSRFWALSTHTNPGVRSSWYQVIVLVCEFSNKESKSEFKWFTEAETPTIKKHLNKYIATALDEAEPGPALAAWRFVLEFADTPNPAAAKALLRALSQGGRGQATQLYSMLKDLIKKLAQQPKEFISQVLKALRQGFQQKTIMWSRSESAAGAQALIDCFFLAKELSIPAKELIQNHLVPVLRHALRNYQHHMLSSPLYQQIHRLIFKWREEKVTIWNSLKEVCLEVLEEPCEDKPESYIFKQHREICTILRGINQSRSFHVKWGDVQTTTVEIVPMEKGCFECALDPNEIRAEKERLEKKRIEKRLENEKEDYIENLDEEINTEEKPLPDISPELLNLIENICSAYIEKKLFLTFTSFAECFPNATLMNNLEQKHGSIQDLLLAQNSPRESIIKLAISRIAFIDAPVIRQEALVKLSEILHGETLVWAINEISSKADTTPEFKDWLQSTSLSDHYIKAVKHVINDQCQEQDLMILDAMMKSKYSIGAEALSQILDLIQAALLNWKNISLQKTLDLCIKLADCKFNQNNNFFDLVLILIKQSYFFMETLEEMEPLIRQACTICLASLNDIQKQLISEKVVLFLKEQPLSNHQNLAQVTCWLIKACENSTEILQIFVKTYHSKIVELSENAWKICLIAEDLLGRYILENEEILQVPDNYSFIELASMILYESSIISDVLKINNDLDINMPEWIENEICLLNRSYLLCLLFEKHYKPSIEYKNLPELLNMLKTNINSLQSDKLEKFFKNDIVYLQLNLEEDGTLIKKGLIQAWHPLINLTQDEDQINVLILEAFEKFKPLILLQSKEYTNGVIWLARYLTYRINKCSSLQVDNLQDFILICASTWAQVLTSDNPKLLIAVLDLFKAIQRYGSDSIDWTESGLCSLTHKAILEIFLKEIANNYDRPNHLIVACRLSEAVQSMKANQFEGSLCIRAIQCCLQKLPDVVSPMQIGAYSILKLLLPTLVKTDTKALNNSETLDDGDVNIQLSLSLFYDLIEKTDLVVTTMLSDVKIGENCLVDSHTDAYQYTNAYLMTWLLVIDLCAQAKAKLRYQYSLALTEKNFASGILSNSVRLLPEHQTSDWNLEENIFDPYDAPSENFICKLACLTYGNMLRHMPALSRRWFNELEPKYASPSVERITSTHVTPWIYNCESKSVQSTASQLQGQSLSIRALANGKHIEATYQVDDARIEVSIHLASNHPLTPPRVESGALQMNTKGKGREWLKNLAALLTHQNGSVAENMFLWKTSLDQKYRGLDECCICYSVLHGSSLQTPKLACSTCRKRFHSACLYRWFSTSNKSSCPICRNLF